MRPATLGMIHSVTQSVFVTFPTEIVVWTPWSGRDLAQESNEIHRDCRHIRAKGAGLQRRTTQRVPAGCAVDDYGRVTVTAFDPASLPVVVMTQTLNEATSSEDVRPASVKNSRGSVGARLATTVSFSVE